MSRGGVHSIDDLRASNADARRVEEFSQGGHQSGTAVLRPVRGDAPIDTNGFIVTNPDGTDGPFRDAARPDNQRFMADLLAQRVPEELEPQVRQASGAAQDVGVNLVSKTSEDYVPAFQAFQGQGFSLRSAQPSAASTFSAARAAPLSLVAGEPVSTVQVAALDGSRHRIQVNAARHTVLDLFQHVMQLTGAPATFDLLGGFPPRPLSDPAATIAQAGLAGSSLRMKAP
ncbi:hypothetical protein PBRA_003536 [Plasmodiophora brassicae]|uniref:UBX domain-containing protein n=1 Tax=Plasmodiophora brassicae TaxID=37360 RepID=A0A0G4J911_PLABS|nr:hypothetical protein PBRA_003536 [Plasmodiophora brassicae]